MGRMLRILICTLALLACDSAWAATAGPGACPPLGPPSGRIIDVGPAQAERLPSIVRDAPAGATVRLGAGRYRVRDAAGLSFARSGVTLRSRSGDPRDVVIDGGYGPSALLRVAASGIMIGEVTLTRARDHLVHAVPPEGGEASRGFGFTAYGSSTAASSSSRRTRMRPRPAGYIARVSTARASG